MVSMVGVVHHVVLSTGQQDCHYRGQVYITLRLSLQRAGMYHTKTVTTEGRYVSHHDCHYRGQVYITPRLSLQRAGIYHTKTVTTEGRYISHQDCHYRGQVYITP